MLIKSALRDLLISVIGLDKHSADWLAALASPFPAAPDFSTGKRVTRFSGRFAFLRIVFPCHPYAGGRINRSMLSCRDRAPWLSTHSPTAPRGKVVAPATKGGCIASSKARLACFPSGEARSSGFRRQRRHKKWRPKGAHLASGHGQPTNR